MGKKKSKVAKVKQAKAKKTSKFGGVTTTMTSSSGKKKLGQAFPSTLTTDAAKNFRLDSKNKVSIQNKKNAPKKVFMAHPSLPPKNEGKKNNNSKNVTNNDEQADFQRQMASLQERQAAATRNTGRKLKKSEWQSKNSSSFLESFQPTSFSVEKTTNELLEDTMDQMQGMSGVGQSNMLSDGFPTPIRSNQSWVTAPRTLVGVGTGDKDGDTDPTASSFRSKNPFAALEEELDDSDNEYADKNSSQAPQQPLFSMAPASFTLLPRVTPTPATTPLREGVHPPTSAIPTLTAVSNALVAEDDIDPDL